jgi:hypothetical protein
LHFNGSMRTAPFLSRLFFVLPFALLTNACAVHQFVDGTVSYTSTPPVADHSGALPSTALLCFGSAGRPNHTAGIRIGSCQLAGFDNPNRAGGDAALQVVGSECALPTLAGPLPLRVANATLQYTHHTIDVTVGGTTTDGRYLTYRFTGTRGSDGASGDCDAVLDVPVSW